jgi:polysaccharide biosynthesis protein PslH
MRVLIICNRLPFPLTTNAFSYRVLNAVKHLKQKHGHSLTLFTFKYEDDSENYLRKYCDDLITFNIPSAEWKRIYYYINLCFRRLLTGKITRANFFDYRYSPLLHDKLLDLMTKKKFDIIFVAEPSMCFYASNSNAPKVIEVWSASIAYFDAYRQEDQLLKKIYYYLNFKLMESYNNEYKKFDVCLVPTEEEKTIMGTILPNTLISVIPFGVNTSFVTEDLKEDFPSILFIGSLNSAFNQRSFNYLYDDIYPIIKNNIKNIRLYVVGKEPPDWILKLAREDSTLIVTGYVTDIKPYLLRASVITLPVHGYGIKTRILEAMAMGKPVITSSEGIHGIDVTPGKDILIANSKEEFAAQIFELLSNEKLRATIGMNAKKLMKDDYSWEKMTDRLNEIFESILKK